MNIRDFLLFAGLNGGSGGSGGGCNIQRIESLDTSNLVSFRDLDSGVYILYGYFTPFTGSDVSMTVDDALVSIARRDAGTHLMCFTALNGKINFIEILVDESAPGGHTYTRTDYKLSELAEQPDWNQNDPTKPDYVKNRTHYTERQEVEYLPYSARTFTEGGCDYYEEIVGSGAENASFPFKWQKFAEVIITFDGVKYTYNLDPVFPSFGNIAILGAPEDTGEPFACNLNNFLVRVQSTDDSTHSFGIVGVIVENHAIPEKYLPSKVTELPKIYEEMGFGLPNSLPNTTFPYKKTRNGREFDEFPTVGGQIKMSLNGIEGSWTFLLDVISATDTTYTATGSFVGTDGISYTVVNVRDGAKVTTTINKKS